MKKILFILMLFVWHQSVGANFDHPSKDLFPKKKAKTCLQLIPGIETPQEESEIVVFPKPESIEIWAIGNQSDLKQVRFKIRILGNEVTVGSLPVGREKAKIIWFAINVAGQFEKSIPLSGRWFPKDNVFIFTNVIFCKPNQNP